MNWIPVLQTPTLHFRWFYEYHLRRTLAVHVKLDSQGDNIDQTIDELAGKVLRVTERVHIAAADGTLGKVRADLPDEYIGTALVSVQELLRYNIF